MTKGSLGEGSIVVLVRNDDVMTLLQTSSQRQTSLANLTYLPLRYSIFIYMSNNFTVTLRVG